MTLRISSELHRRLLAEAAASPDQEVCGLLFGSDTVERVLPTANMAADPATAFEIDSAALFAAIRAERAGAEQLMGYYHSHPVGPPRPSARDRAQAVADGRVWLIIGERRLTAWKLIDANKFNAIELIIGD